MKTVFLSDVAHVLVVILWISCLCYSQQNRLDQDLLDLKLLGLRLETKLTVIDSKLSQLDAIALSSSQRNLDDSLRRIEDKTSSTTLQLETVTSKLDHLRSSLLSTQRTLSSRGSEVEDLSRQQPSSQNGYRTSQEVDTSQEAHERILRAQQSIIDVSNRNTVELENLSNLLYTQTTMLMNRSDSILDILRPKVSPSKSRITRDSGVALLRQVRSTIDQCWETTHQQVTKVWKNLCSSPSSTTSVNMLAVEIDSSLEEIARIERNMRTFGENGPKLTQVASASRKLAESLKMIPSVPDSLRYLAQNMTATLTVINHAVNPLINSVTQSLTALQASLNSIQHVAVNLTKSVAAAPCEDIAAADVDARSANQKYT